MGEVRVFAFLAAVGQEIDAAIFFVNRDDAAHPPGAVGQLAFELAGLCVVEIDMVPAIALGSPNDFSGIVSKLILSFARIDVVRRFFANQRFLLAGCRVYFAKFDGLLSTLVIIVEDALAVGKPVEAGAILERKFERRGFEGCGFCGWGLEKDWVCGWDMLT